MNWHLSYGIRLNAEPRSSRLFITYIYIFLQLRGCRLFVKHSTQVRETFISGNGFFSSRVQKTVRSFLLAYLITIEIPRWTHEAEGSIWAIWSRECLALS
jgi:hypothetical protein